MSNSISPVSLVALSDSSQTQSNLMIRSYPKNMCIALAEPPEINQYTLPTPSFQGRCIVEFEVGSENVSARQSALPPVIIRVREGGKGDNLTHLGLEVEVCRMVRSVRGRLMLAIRNRCGT